MAGIQFTEENIQSLFGYEAAEDEKIDRLKEYYLKNKIYSRITADLPLRILVGHKGTGKSALFKIAVEEDKDNGLLPILIKPDDIAALNTNDKDFFQAMRIWKDGLNEIIGAKVLNSLGVESADTIDRIKKYGGKILNFIIDSVNSPPISCTPAKKMLIQNFTRNQKVIVYIDDLDRGWFGTKNDIMRISTMLNAIRDIINENKGIYFRISLRSDVYFLVRTSDESTDKIEGSVTWYSWTNHEILVMLIKRIETFFGHKVDEEKLLSTPQFQLAKYLDSVMEARFSGQGKWNNSPMYKILMSLIRKRPRDLVKLCTLAARQAFEENSSLILTKHFEIIFGEYSQGRIQDTINEYRSELPEIERLIMGMRPNRAEKKASMGYTYDSEKLNRKIANLISLGSFDFTSFDPNKKKTATAAELATFLYKINFLTARKVLPDGHIDRKYFEENRYLSGHFADFGYDWEIHPAYRWALQPDFQNSVMLTVDVDLD